jgi:organic radical activating enzyme
MNIEFDVTLQCNFSCLNCNRHSNFNNLKDPTGRGVDKAINLYENTDIKLAQVKKFIQEVKDHGDVHRIHLIGGEPLVHPYMDQICDLIRDELFGTHVPEILIISNIHPKMLKAGTLDTSEEFLRKFPWDRFDKINLKSITGISRDVITIIYDYMRETNCSIEDVINSIDQFMLEFTANQPYSLRTLLEGKYTLEGKDERQYFSFFHGIPVINYKPLSAKADEHRCTLVAPIDTGQEMIETCNIPNHCGINYSFDGYWPCSNASAIARLFKLDKYRKTSLPKSITEWDGIDEKGNATVHNSGMWDVCKLCQVAAKKHMDEKDFGRPISISYRKALGMEPTDTSISDFVIDAHKKKLATVPKHLK